MDRCAVMARVRDAYVDDVKATTIEEKRKRKHMSIINEDFHEPKFNLDLCTNLVVVPILGQVMLNPL